MILKKSDIQEIIKLLKDGKIGILPTDTVYGIHCLSSNKDQVDKIHILKKEDVSIPLITLIDNVKYLSDFGVEIRAFEKDSISKYWPGTNTLIFITKEGGTKSFRIPSDDFLISILKETGPLVSTSANTHGGPTCLNIKGAIKYFGDGVDFYVDGGNLNSPPSNIYRIEKGSIIKIR